MPAQELFFEQTVAGRRIEVVKTYDEQFAREAFDSMDEAAQEHLWQALKPEEIYDPASLPGPDEPIDREAFLWDELVTQAREDWKTFSYFVVNEARDGQSQSLYVSPDWPSAEAFAKQQLTIVAT
jgi:hypothetical protein